MAKRVSPSLIRPPPVDRPPNKLLAALPTADYRRLLPLFTRSPLKFKQVLHKIGEKIDTVYFPVGGCCSATYVMQDGRMVEVATIGSEGMVGITVFLGGDIAPGDTFVQIADGNALAMPVEVFRRELDRRGALYEVIGRFAQALQILNMQSIACNSFHRVEERCARWLLMTHDRLENDDLPLTHEFLSYMLGVRRPTVSLVLGTLDKAGVIRNGMKKITVVNRARLEEVSCECYEVVKKAFDRLLPQQA
jgi:CRP-like cAMP-binding protein